MRLLTSKWLAGTAVALTATAIATPAALAASPRASTMTAQAHVASSTSPANTAAALANIKAKAAAAISLRESALQATISAVNANHSLTTTDRAAVLTTLNGDVSGLNALGPVIQVDTTVAQATADYRSIFLNFRVFVLALPQTRMAASADDLTGTVLPHLTDAQSRLAALLAGPESSKDTPAVQAAMADLGKQISAITSDTNGLASQVLSYHPADWNANPTILAQPRANLVSARAAAIQARADITDVVAVLK
jgi:hypothetical protein